MGRVRVDIHLRWGDQDEYGHINNVAFARYLEEARVRIFGSNAAHTPTGMETLLHGNNEDPHKMLLASQRIEFVGVLEYSHSAVVVEMWVGKVGGSSLELHSEIVDGASTARRVVARAISNVVIVDYHTLRPKKLTASERDVVEAWTDEPLSLRRL